MQYLLHYLLSLKHWMNRHSWDRTPVAMAAWALLRDSYHGPLCLQHSPQHIAVSVLYLALQCYGVEVPGDAEAERPWWQVREEYACRLGVYVLAQKGSGLDQSYCLLLSVLRWQYII